MRLLSAALMIAATAAHGAHAHRATSSRNVPSAAAPLKRDSAKLGDYGNIGVWPLPANATYVGQGPLNPFNFSIQITGPVGDPYLTEVAKRYTDIILYHPQPVQPSGAAFTTLFVNVSQPGVRVIQQDTDESYTLTFNLPSSATITANTIFGARHAMETFSQLVTADRLAGTYSVQGYNINEAPRFPFRGLLIDSARHWLNPNLLLNLMDAMSFHKMNTLQIGFGIDWSWTVESAAFPNLTQTLTYGPKGTHYFSREMVQFLVSEANLRGLRLIPYFEVVGHDALGIAVPQIFFCNGVQGNGLPHPLHPETWAFFDALWADLKELFPEDYLNFGGDEFDSTCWVNDPEINAWITNNGYPNSTDYITAYYYQQQFASLKKAGFKPIMFAEAFGVLNGTGVSLVGTDIIFDGWDEGTPGSMAPVIQADGAKVIISSYCFLAPTQSCPDNLPGGLTPNWDSNYRCEIQNTTLFPPEAIPYLDRIVGGHPSRWGEQTDGTNIWQFTYPAAMGAAEKLWSPLSLTNGSYYGSRQEVFADHRCTLIRRGIPVQPTSAYSWSCDYEWEPAYPPLTPKRPNPSHSSWVNNMTATVVVNPTSSPADAPTLKAELAAARTRVKELEAKLASLEQE